MDKGEIFSQALVGSNGYGGDGVVGHSIEMETTLGDTF